MINVSAQGAGVYQPRCLPLSIALHPYLRGVAQAHEGNRSRRTLAWHNLLVVNHLAVVCVHWHELIMRYSQHEAVEAVYALLASVAKTHRTLLLTSERRNKLPMVIQFRAFDDHIFDNCGAISRHMVAWTGISCTRRHCPQTDYLSIKYGLSGQVADIYGWNPTMLTHCHHFSQGHSASAMRVRTQSSEPTGIVRRCKSLPSFL